MIEKLPNSEKAVVESGKLTKYVLSLDHIEGQWKAKFFMQCGFNAAEFEELQASLLKHAVTQQVIAVKQSDYGVKYILECQMESPNRRNPCICSVWIVNTGESFPRLVTAYPNP